MRYAFAGDRAISTYILKFLISKGHKPLALLVCSEKKATHSSVLINLANLEDDLVLRGNDFKSAENIQKIKSLNLDYIFGIHFPYIIPSEVLNLPKVGFLNLHPAYLPYNKGWHTPSWAILDKTTYGATLHFMAEELDKGDIIHQRAIDVKPYDTANSLYQKTLALEEDVFKEAYDKLISLNPPRQKQVEIGTSHNKKDLAEEQEIILDDKIVASALINKMRALTTNDIQEAAFFEIDGRTYAVQISLQEIN